MGHFAEKAVRDFVVRVVIDADVLQKVIQRRRVSPLTSILDALLIFAPTLTRNDKPFSEPVGDIIDLSIDSTDFARRVSGWFYRRVMFLRKRLGKFESA